MSSIRTLKIFLAVVRDGNFVAAGKSIGLTPAAIGVQMRKLEEEFNLALFDRSSRSIVVNNTGRRLAEQVRTLVSDYESLLECESERGFAGSFVVGAVVSALLGAFANALQRLKQDYPRLDIKLLSGISSNFAAQVISGELDAAVVTQPPYVLPNHLRWTLLYTERMVLIVPSRPIFQLAEEPLQILREAPFLRFDQQTWTGYLVNEILLHYDIDTLTTMELNSAEAIIELVRHGFGVSIVPRLANVGWDNDKDLRIMPLPDIDMYRRVGLLERTQHSRQRITAEISRFFTESHP